MNHLENLEALVSLVEAETGVKTTRRDEPSDEPVGWDGDGYPLAMTFGHVRRAREELDALTREGSTDA